MSQLTKDINKITKTIIVISGKLIVYALILMLLAEGMTRGYAFGHEIFYATAVDEPPGKDLEITIPKDQSDRETIAILADLGLVKSELAVHIQKWFYDYDIYPGTYILNTSMTSKEMLQLLNEKPVEETPVEETQGEGVAITP